ncbi:MAG: putative Fe-S cluster assembly protein SufT [Thermoanaerobaculia bacterium]
MSSANSPDVVLTREVDAVVIPHGSATRIPNGTKVKIMQKLGGTVTVTTEHGGLYRIEPENLDALGLDVPAAAPVDENEAAKSLEERVWDQLRTCFDPEIPVNIVELGLVYSCQLTPSGEDGRQAAAIQLTLTAPGCGMGDVLAQDIQKKLERLPEIASAKVEVVFDPPWNQSMMSEAARLQLGFY